MKFNSKSYKPNGTLQYQMAFFFSFSNFLLGFNMRGFVGRDGLTHNMLNDIHNNWKQGEAVRIKCMGVPTIDMKNVCTQLEVRSFHLPFMHSICTTFLVSYIIEYTCRV